VNCPLCESDRTGRRRDCRSPFVEHVYRLYACAACGSAFFDVDEHEIDLARVYEDYAGTSVADYSADVPQSYYWAAQVDLIRKLHRGAVRSVLDVGCRTGDFLMHWPVEVERVGVELSERAADVAEQRGLHVFRGFVEDIRVTDPFDVVSCYALVEHLRQPADFLRDLPRLLNANGLLVILVPTRQCLKHWLLQLGGVQWHMYSPPQHLNFPSRARLDAILGEVGMRRVSRHYTSGSTFNPFRRIPRLGTWFDTLMLRVDHGSPVNRLPLFDHMYSVYEKSA